MVMKEGLEQQEENRAIIPATLPENSPGEAGKPVAPRGITDEETQELQGRAEDLVNELQAASGVRELELIDSVASVGIQAQRRAKSELDLLRGRVGDMITREGTGTTVSKDLAELRLALNEINPHELGQRGMARRLFAMVPVVGKFAPEIRVLERIAIRYEPVSRQISVIEDRLREGRMMLVRDNLEMRQLYEQVEAQQQPIQKNAYLGQLVMERLSQLIDRIDDTLKVERFRNTLQMCRCGYRTCGRWRRSISNSLSA